MRHFFCLLFCSRNGCLTGQHYAGRTLGTVFPPLLSSHQVSPCGNGVGGMFLRPRAFTTMNIEFNGANPCTPKNLAKQLIVESAKILNHQQRQALVDIFKTLDQAEKSTLDNLESLQKSEPKRKKHSQDFIYKDEYAENEFNQEYWSGQHYDSYNQEYPEDWVKRTHQRPRHSTFTSNY